MDLTAQIKNMLGEIIDYGGDFGDPIATVYTFKPLVVLEQSEPNSFIAFGAAIALLVDFAVYCDNSGYVNALQSHTLKNMQKCIHSNKISKYSFIISAFKAAEQSEADFNDALSLVYKNYVVNWKKIA